MRTAAPLVLLLHVALAFRRGRVGFVSYMPFPRYEDTLGRGNVSTYRHVSGGWAAYRRIEADERDSLSRPESLVSKPIYYFELAKIRLKYILKTGQS